MSRWTGPFWPYSMYEGVHLDPERGTVEYVMARDLETLAAIFWWLVANDDEGEALGE